MLSNLDVVGEQEAPAYPGIAIPNPCTRKTKIANEKRNKRKTGNRKTREKNDKRNAEEGSREGARGRRRVGSLNPKSETVIPKPEIRNLNQNLNPESRIPNPESRITNHESRITNPQSRIPHPKSRIPYPESRIPNPESRIPNL